MYRMFFHSVTHGECVSSSLPSSKSKWKYCMLYEVTPIPIDKWIMNPHARITNSLLEPMVQTDHFIWSHPVGTILQWLISWSAVEGWLSSVVSQVGEMSLTTGVLCLNDTALLVYFGIRLLLHGVSRDYRQYCMIQ